MKIFIKAVLSWPSTGKIEVKFWKNCNFIYILNMCKQEKISNKYNEIYIFAKKKKGMGGVCEIVHYNQIADSKGVQIHLTSLEVLQAIKIN